MKVTIGYITDLTGPAANGFATINIGLEDIVRYYNEEHIIPGVELEVRTYDGQLDPAYEWLRERGADVIFTGVPATALTLENRVNADKCVMFTMSGDPVALDPPGYVFTPSSLPAHEAVTLLKWIAENHWDYRTNGPAKVGGGGWDDAYTGWWLNSVERYCAAHPDQFEWAGAYLTMVGNFNWTAESEALKDVDYVLPCSVMTTFVKQFREAGGKGTFIGAEPHTAFLGLINTAQRWDDIDGMLFVRSIRWWNEEGDLVGLNKELLARYRPGEAEKIMAAGVGYLSQINMYLMLDIIGRAVEEVGAESFDSQALYDAARSYSMEIDGIERYSFGEGKRWATNYYAVYEASGERQDIFRVTPDWLPVVVDP